MMKDLTNIENQKSEAIHNYDEGSGLFARAVGHEKLAIILPAIRSEFNRIVASNGFSPETDKVLDFGCGPFSLSIPFIRDLIHVDGVDSSLEMLNTAKETIEQWKPKFTAQAVEIMEQVKLTSSASEIRDEDYQLAMMNFMHQCASTPKELKRYFRDVSDKMKDGGHLIITGAHPEFLHNPHACCEYDVKDSSKLSDGDVYTGRIFNETGESVYELKSDYYWSFNAITEAANDGGDLRLISVTEVDDKETAARQANSPAYFLMHLRK